MTVNNWVEPKIANKKAYDELIVAIEASQGILSLLIAVCDDSNYRDEMIREYEKELQPDIRCYQVELARGEPSLKVAIAELVQGNAYLKNQGRAVLMVTGAEKLYFLKFGAERSEQEIFFGYLQWTREALRDFPYPIVLWVTNQILANLSKKSPDFWSWRKGVFRFVSKKTATVPSQEIRDLPIRLYENEFPTTNDDNPYFLPIEDLEALIQQTEQQRGVKEPNLATLYQRMGLLYQRRLDRGESQDYKQEQELAIKYFRKAIDLQKELEQEIELADSLNYLADFYLSQGNYSEAESLLLQALELRKRLLGEQHLDVATTLNYIAAIYDYQGRYKEAESLLKQALKIRKDKFGKEHFLVANILNHLAGIYESQGRYSEAELLYVEVLALRKRLLGEEHPDVANTLNNLAFLYYTQGRYSEAEPLDKQALALRERLLGEEHPDVATSLNHLGRLYYIQKRYKEAEPLLLRALLLRDRLLGEENPLTANSLNILGLLYNEQDRYNDAEPLLVKALKFYEQSLGIEHPKAVTIRKILEKRSTG